MPSGAGGSADAGGGDGRGGADGSGNADGADGAGSSGGADGAGGADGVAQEASCRPSTVPAAITSLDVGGPGARRRQSDADEVGGVEALGSGAGMCLHRSRERCMRVVQPLSVR